jgi:hypothetical protein
VQLLRKLNCACLRVTVAEHLGLFSFRGQVNLLNALMRRSANHFWIGVTSLISFFFAAMMPECRVANLANA